MIVKKEKKGGVMVYYVKKILSDEKMNAMKGNFIKPSQINFIIKDDADVYAVDGDNEGGEGEEGRKEGKEEGRKEKGDKKLLLRFRKNKLTKKKIEDFYENVIEFAETETTARGVASGSDSRITGYNPKIKSNVLGYIDKMSVSQKAILKRKGLKILPVRETRFNRDYPEKFAKVVPLIKEIDEYYEKYAPEYYKKQRQKANQTPFKICGTSFTTVTTNVNFQTALHKDKGDDEEGFGNLVVIEKGKYSGAETCFPQYGIGVDVRYGDVLYMNVHEWHANLPMKKSGDDAKRLSIVCYLRYNLWDMTKHMSKNTMAAHTRKLRNILGKFGNMNKNVTEKALTVKSASSSNKTKKNKKTKRSKG